MRKSTSNAIRVVSLGLLLDTFLAAQVNSGTILGTVTDPTGAVVTGVELPL